MDLISELPESITHRIMSLLPSHDAAKTSVFSKRWNQIWDTYPFCDFNQTYFDHSGERFVSFVNSKLQKFSQAEVCLPKFKLFVTRFSPEIRGLVDKWLGIAVDKNVGEIDLYIEYNRKISYTFPWKVLTAETLNVLRLCGCKLELEQSLLVKRTSRAYPLRKLSLLDVQIDEPLMQSLFVLFPLIEELSVRYCWKLRNLSVSKLVKLKEFDVAYPRTMPKKVEIDAQALQTICLQCVILDEKMVENIFKRCPFIEHVVLSSCRGLRHIDVSGLANLKRLKLGVDSEEMKRIDLRTPSLEHFNLDCNHESYSPLINLDAVMCTRLKFLELTRATIDDKTLHELVSKFPLLEVLSLSYCNLLEKVEISSDKLKSLTFNRCKNLIDGKINAPKLSLFHYIGETIPCLSLVNARCKWEVTIDLSGKDHFDNGFFIQLKEFLRKATQIKALKLLFVSAKSMTAEFDIQGLGDLFLAQENNLELLLLNISKPSHDYAALLDGLLWGCCPKKICLELSPKYAKDCITSVLEKMKERDGRFNPASFDSSWRHCTQDDVKITISVRTNKQGRSQHWRKLHLPVYNIMNLDTLMDELSILEADQFRLTIDWSTDT